MHRRRAVSGLLLAAGGCLLVALVAAGLVVDAGAWSDRFAAPFFVVTAAALGALATVAGGYGLAADSPLTTRRALTLALVATALALPFVELVAPVLRDGYQVGLAYEYVTLAFLLTVALPVGVQLGRPDEGGLRPFALAVGLVAAGHALVLAARVVLQTGGLSTEALGTVALTIVGNVVAYGFLLVADTPLPVPGVGGLFAVAPLVAGAVYGSVIASDGGLAAPTESRDGPRVPRRN